MQLTRGDRVRWLTSGLAAIGLWLICGQAQAQLLSDTFESGSFSQWTSTEGSWSVVTDGTKVLQGSNTSGYARVNAGSSTWTDQTVEARVKAVSFSGSDRFVVIGARYMDANNYYYVAMRSSNKLELKRLKAGSPSTLSFTSMTVSSGTWYTVRLEVVGSALKVYVNGSLKLSATDTSFTKGKVMMGVYYGKASFDDVSVTSGAKPPMVLRPTPGSGSVLVSTGPTLSWQAATGATSYEVHFGKTSPPALVNTVTGTSYTPGTLTADTTYYWQINAKNAGGMTAGQIWTFTTNGPVDNRPLVDGNFADPTTWFVTPGKKGQISPWRYQFSAVAAAGWNSPSFNDSAWSVGYAGFGIQPQTGDVVNTPWPADASDLWMRQTFTVTAADIPRLALWGRWDDYFEVYINGVLAATTQEWLNDVPNGQHNLKAVHWGWIDAYRYYGITAEARAAVQPGSNTITVHARNAGGPGYIDIGLTLNPAYNPPVSGTDADASWAPYAEVVRKYMEDNVIPAGVLAVLKNNQLVSLHGLGYMDKARTIPVPPNAVLRLASVDKAITQAAVRRLIDTMVADPITGERITDSTRVFPLLRAHGITALAGMTPDINIDSITVKHLMEHRSGLAGLPDIATLYAKAGKSRETYAPIDNIRYVYSAPLAFVPGTQNAYSSSGYMLLRYVVEAVTGSLEGYLQNSLFAPVGSRDVFVAHERLPMRLPREPWYASLQSQPPDYWVNYDYCTALSTSAEGFVRFSRGYHFVTGQLQVNLTTGVLSQPDLWQPQNPQTWYWAGGMAGTAAYATQRNYDDTHIVVIFNLGGHFDRLSDRLGGSATDPVPASASMAVSTTPTLSWQPGLTPGTHEFMLGTAPGQWTVTGTTSASSFNPGTLQPNTTYYWQVNTRIGSGISVGGTWSFTTGSGPTTIVNRNNATSGDMCFAVADGSTSNGARILQSPCGADPVPGYRQFELTDVSNGLGHYTAKAVSSGKCVTVQGNSLTAGASIVQSDCAGSSNQVFDLQHTSDGFGHLVAESSGLCLTVSGDAVTSTNSGQPIIQMPCRSSLTTQEFAVYQSPQTRVAVVNRNNAAFGNMCFDVSGGSTANDAAIIQWTCGPWPLPTGRQFIRVDQGNGLFNLRGVNSGKCVTVHFNDSAAGRDMIQYDCNGLSNQLFAFVPTSSGFGRIVAQNSNLCLTVSGDAATSTYSGQSIVQNPCTSGLTTQEFRLQPVPLL